MGINVNISALSVTSLEEAQKEITLLLEKAKAAMEAAANAASDPIGSAIKSKFEQFNNDEYAELQTAIGDVINSLGNLTQNYDQGVQSLLDDINSITITADEGTNTAGAGTN